MSWLLTPLGLIVGVVLAAVVLANMIRQPRAPSATIAWLLVILLVPYVGVPAYLLLGGRKMRRMAEDKPDLRVAGTTAHVVATPGSLDAVLRSYGIAGATRGNRVRLCGSGEEAYRWLTQLLEDARHRIWLASFILHPDGVGRAVLDLLARRARDGLQVRLLLDGVGSLHTSHRVLAPLAAAGGRYAFFMPVFHRPFRGRSNLRNHRKVVYVDDHLVVAGGANIAREYMGPTVLPERWRDLAFVLEGPATYEYGELFRSDWHYASREWLDLPAAEPLSRGDAIAQVVPSGPDVDRDPLYAAILSASWQAHQRLWVVTPYYIPDDALQSALVLAAHRGVDVRVLVPARSNHRLADLARGAYLRDIQEAGGSVLLYRSGMVHAKALVVDDTVAMVGSANMDMRSLFLNYEVALFLYTGPEVRATADWIASLEGAATRGVPVVSAGMEVVEGLARMIGPQL